MNQGAVIKKTRVLRSSNDPHEDQEKQTIKPFRSLPYSNSADIATYHNTKERGFHVLICEIKCFFSKVERSFILGGEVA